MTCARDSSCSSCATLAAAATCLTTYCRTLSPFLTELTVCALVRSFGGFSGAGTSPRHKRAARPVFKKRQRALHRPFQAGSRIGCAPPSVARGERSRHPIMTGRLRSNALKSLRKSQRLNIAGICQKVGDGRFQADPKACCLSVVRILRTASINACAKPHLDLFFSGFSYFEAFSFKVSVTGPSRQHRSTETDLASPFRPGFSSRSSIGKADAVSFLWSGPITELECAVVRRFPLVGANPTQQLSLSFGSSQCDGVDAPSERRHSAPEKTRRAAR